MKDIPQIIDGVMVLLSRVRDKSVSLDGIERGLESIAFDLSRINTAKPPPGTGFSLDKATALRRDIDALTLKWDDVKKPGTRVRIKTSVPTWGGCVGVVRRYLSNSDCVELSICGTWLCFGKHELRCVE